MEGSQNGGNVVKFATIFEKFSYRILNQLKSGYLRFRDTVK